MNNTIDVWNIHLPDCRVEVELCRSLLADEELARAAKFFKPKDADRFILCRGLLRRILGELLETDPSALVFSRNEHGKPFLADTDVEFNVSHSRDRLLVAVSSGRALGVDIEFRRSGINMDAIAERWFAPEERAFFRGLENPEEGFFDIWAKKEAYVKALGIGIFKELHAFAVPLGDAPGFPSIGKNGEWFFQTLEIDPAYAAALVSKAPAVPVNLKTISF
ncbi:MAG: 4'-phosphopantetheinyl transferase superfamily protein [Verrucomicrobia bacterium]|nr:4'-phosphopantetheinyl transferase superfamily protein [Verrucomicrobiota bacterium]